MSLTLLPPLSGAATNGGEGEGRSNIKALLRQRTLQRFNIPAPFALPAPAIDGHGGKGSSCPVAGNLKGPRAPDAAALL